MYRVGAPSWRVSLSQTENPVSVPELWALSFTTFTKQNFKPMKDIADLRGDVGAQGTPAPCSANFFHFQVLFGENLSK